jgi:hypothetical protein
MRRATDIAGWAEQPAGQATFEMANLRPQRTGLPFVVFISQKANAPHDVRVKVSPGPKVSPSQMGSYALRPFRHVAGVQLTAAEEKQLEAWVGKNLQVLVEYWDGDIEYTEDALERLVSI